MKAPTSNSRRRFLATAAAASVQIVPRHVLGGPKHTAPSEKLNIAGIGFGGVGSYNLAMCAKTDHIAALCDLDHHYAKKVFDQYPDAKRFKDYRELLGSDVDFDAVVIATPDHTHAVLSAAAMHAGKHVFCQKPLTHGVHESRQLAKIAKETGVSTQLGIQGHSNEGLRLISEWIWDGAIGEVAEVEAWCSISYVPHGHAAWSSPLGERPKEGEPVPDGFDWDAWIGPAPTRPYHSCYHPMVWRCWWDFGSGMMGDRGVHTIDAIVSSLKLPAPESIECTYVKGGNAEVHPEAARIEYRFPARDGFPPLKLTWREGEDPPRPKELEAGRKFPLEGGVIYKGSKGLLMNDVYGGSPRLIPEAAMQAYKRPEKTLPRVEGGHEQDWIRACKAAKYDGAGAHFGYGGHLTETVLLGNVAKRFPHRKLLWDPEKLQITNHEEANAWIRRPYRKGWSLEKAT